MIFGQKMLLNFIFPPLCLHCKRAVKDGVLCSACLELIECRKTFFCGECLARLPLSQKVCHRNFPYILGAAGNYGDETLRDLIRGLKFQLLSEAAFPLAELLIRYAEGLIPSRKNAIVMPVPLGRRRMRERGFNQSDLIARIFAEHFRLPLSLENLTRLRDTLPQSELLSLEARRKNVLGCFGLRKPEEVEGASIILIDDVVTSGATLREAAYLLKSSGARGVTALCVAKA